MGLSSAGYNIYVLLLTLASIGVPNAISKLVAERTTLGDHKGAFRIFKIALLTFGAIRTYWKFISIYRCTYNCY